jgi:fucose permease
MKTIREKMAQNEALSWGEWSTLAAVKLFALSIAFGAIGGSVMLVFKPLLTGVTEGVFFPTIPYALAILAVMEGAPALAKKVHDKLLSWFERLYRHAD